MCLCFCFCFFFTPCSIWQDTICYDAYTTCSNYPDGLFSFLFFPTSFISSNPWIFLFIYSILSTNILRTPKPTLTHLSFYTDTYPCLPYLSTHLSPGTHTLPFFSCCIPRTYCGYTVSFYHTNIVCVCLTSSLSFSYFFFFHFFFRFPLVLYVLYVS